MPASSTPLADADALERGGAAAVDARPLLASEESASSSSSSSSSSTTTTSARGFVEVEAKPSGGLAAGGSRRSLFRCCAGALLSLALVSGLGMAWLSHAGAFDHVNRAPPKLNGTHVVEPNTGMQIPVELPATLEGLPRPQRLISVHMESYAFAGLEFRVFVEAVYVDRELGRKFLARWRDEPATAPHDAGALAPDFVADVSNYEHVREGMTLTFVYSQLVTPPVSQNFVVTTWLQHFVPIWRDREALGDDRIQTLSDTFRGWFLPNGYRKGDAFAFEWRASKSRVRFNDRFREPVCFDDAMGKAWSFSELNKNGAAMANLLPLLWDKALDGRTDGV